MRKAAVALVALVMAGCPTQPAFTPGSFVEKLRVLDIQANPPDVTPGEQTLMKSLVVDPYAGAHPISFLWVMCDPDPSGSGASPCSDKADLRGLSDLTGADGGSLPDGVHVFPFGDSVFYTAPAGTFDTFPPGSPERANGVTATILLATWEGTSPSDLESSDTVKQLALKRIRIVTPGSVRNHNPQIAQVLLAGKPFTDDAPPKVKPGTVVSLSATATAGSAEKYERDLPDGTRLEVTEPMVFSWYANAGALDEVQRESARTTEGQGIDFQVPAWADTANGVVDLWIVLRDDRGGSDFTHRKLIVEGP